MEREVRHVWEMQPGLQPQLNQMVLFKVIAFHICGHFEDGYKWLRRKNNLCKHLYRDSGDRIRRGNLVQF